MKRVLLMCILFLGGLRLSAQEITFVEGDLAGALKQAKEKGKPLFIDFYATWCGPCKMLEFQVFSNPDVASYYNEHFICCRIDVDKNRAVAERFRVSAMPTLVFLNCNGKEIERATGFIPVSRFLRWGQEITGDRKPYPDLYKEYRDNPDNLQLAQELLLDAPSYAQAAGKAAVLWQKRAFGLFEDYLRRKGLDNMVNADDFRLLLLYQSEPLRGDSVLNFVNAHVSDFERVASNIQEVWQYIISRQNALVNALAKAGDLAYKDEIARVNGDMAHAYSKIKHPNLTVREALLLQADGNYALYAEKNEKKYLDIQEAYFKRLGNDVSFANYQQAIGMLVAARKGKLEKDSYRRCISWLDDATRMNLQTQDQMNLSCLMGNCFYGLKDIEKAKACFNQAFVLAMQLNDQRMQMQIKSMLSQLEAE